MPVVRRYWSLVTQSIQAWSDDYAASMGAALAYYTTFSLAPVLLIVIAIAGLAFGQDAARGQIVSQLSGLVGEPGAKAIEGALGSVDHPASGISATIIGIVTLLLGATSVFSELQSALDRIWRAPALPQQFDILSLIRSRLLSFGMVIAMGFLLLVSLVVDAGLSALGKWGGGLFPGAVVALQVLNLVVGFAVTTAVFAAAYRILPRVKIQWSDVWVGSFVTAALFTIGKYLIGVYLGRVGVGSTFGAAGSFIVILVWVYYSAQIFLLGAEFTWVFAHRHGSRQDAPASGDGAALRTSRPRAS